MSPTVLQSGPYRFFFYSSDRGEPTHVHITRERKEAKFWLEPVRLEFDKVSHRMNSARLKVSSVNIRQRC